MTERMRILTVKQPWAWAILRGKDVENRPRSLAGEWTGPVAIHVALNDDNNAFTYDAPTTRVLNAVADLWVETAKVGQSAPWHLNHGHIIGVVDLVNSHLCGIGGQCDPTGQDLGLCSWWGEQDRWHMVLDNPRPLSDPIPFRGGQGLRWLPDEVATSVMAGVTA